MIQIRQLSLPHGLRTANDQLELNLAAAQADQLDMNLALLMQDRLEICRRSPLGRGCRLPAVGGAHALNAHSGLRMTDLNFQPIIHLANQLHLPQR